jgi:hypothetical protein
MQCHHHLSKDEYPNLYQSLTLEEQILEECRFDNKPINWHAIENLNEDQKKALEELQKLIELLTVEIKNEDRFYKVPSYIAGDIETRLHSEVEMNRDHSLGHRRAAAGYLRSIIFREMNIHSIYQYAYGSFDDFINTLKLLHCDSHKKELLDHYIKLITVGLLMSPDSKTDKEIKSICHPQPNKSIPYLTNNYAETLFLFGAYRDEPKDKSMTQNHCHKHTRSCGS